MIVPDLFTGFVKNALVVVGEKGAIMGAVSMYLNFLNLFMFLLSLLGNRN